MRQIILLAALFCLSGGVSILLAGDSTQPVNGAKTAFGDTAIAIFTAPTKIEAFRIRSHLQANAFTKSAAGYVVTGQEKALNKAFATRLGAVLADDKSYDFSDLAGCFEPGVAFRIYKDDAFVDVAICFDCGNLLVVRNDKPSGRVTFIARKELVELAKEAFPKDGDIQALNEGKQ